MCRDVKCGWYFLSGCICFGSARFVNIPLETVLCVRTVRDKVTVSMWGVACNYSSRNVGILFYPAISSRRLIWLLHNVDILAEHHVH